MIETVDFVTHRHTHIKHTANTYRLLILNSKKMKLIQKKKCNQQQHTHKKKRYKNVLHLIHSFKLFPRFSNEQKANVNIVREIFSPFFCSSYILWCESKGCNHFKDIHKEKKCADFMGNKTYNNKKLFVFVFFSFFLFSFK